MKDPAFLFYSTIFTREHALCYLRSGLVICSPASSTTAPGTIPPSSTSVVLHELVCECRPTIELLVVDDCLKR